MAGFALRKNIRFDWAGGLYRIERIQPNGDVLLERLQDGNLLLSTRSELLQEFAAGHIVASADLSNDPRSGAPVFSRPMSDLSPERQAEAKRRLHYVLRLQDEGPVVYSAAFLKPWIARIAAEVNDTRPPSVTTLYRWASRYRTFRDPRALIPRTDLRGRKALRQADRILELAAEATEDAFRASPLSTVKTIHDRLRAKVTIENQARFNGDELKPPSLRTMYRILDRVDAYDRLALREGKAAADRRLRINRRGVTTSQILERAEIDHTPLDLFLVDDRTWLPLGRPTLTVVIEHYSRMLLGYSLSYGEPSAAAAMAALRHAILPKPPMSTSIPELPIEHTWPCYGRPDVLVVDNGMEFHGNSLDNVALDLGITILYCPKHQPRFKGTVERYLKRVNYSFAHQLPGTSFARWHKRGDYDPQRHALLTLAQFRHVFEKWVVDVYAQDLHRGIGTTPAARWREGLMRREPELPGDLQRLQQAIGLTADRSLRRDGISMHGIRYRSDDLQPILSAYGEGVRVRIVYDPSDLGAIQVFGPDADSPVKVLAIDQAYAAGLSADQNEAIRAKLREQGEIDTDAVALQRAKMQLAQYIQDLMSSGKQKHRRQGAKLRGDPVPQSVTPADVVATPTRPTRKPNSEAMSNPPVPAYPSFQLS